MKNYPILINILNKEEKEITVEEKNFIFQAVNQWQRILQESNIK